MNVCQPAPAAVEIFHDAFYKFVAIEDPDSFATCLRGMTQDLLGSILVAGEGINGMLAGSAQALDAFQATLTQDPRFQGKFAGMHFKRSPCTTKPFNKLKIHRKPEIVPLGIEGIDATCRTGINVSPADWQQLIHEDDVIVIDNRNSFEYRLGRFKNAINPQVANFRDFPNYVKDHIEDWKMDGKRVAMYCTGGIRCEKTSAWMLDLGLPVYQLEGGILNYFIEMPDADKDWEGECFVFDNRIALDTHLIETGTTLEDVYDGERDGAPGCSGPGDARLLAQNHLAADFTAGMGGRVDIRVPLAGEQIRSLLAGQRGPPLQRARDGGLERQHDARVRANLCRAMEMRCGRRAAQVAKRHLPAQQQSVLVQHSVNLAGRIGHDGRHLVGACHGGAEGGKVGIGLQRAAPGNGKHDGSARKRSANRKAVIHHPCLLVGQAVAQWQWGNGNGPGPPAMSVPAATAM